MNLTIRGMSGAITGTTGDIGSLAKELLLVGYDIRLDSQPVRLEHGPGYDTVVFTETCEAVR